MGPLGSNPNPVGAILTAAKKAVQASNARPGSLPLPSRVDYKASVTAPISIVTGRRRADRSRVQGDAYRHADPVLSARNGRLERQVHSNRLGEAAVVMEPSPMFCVLPLDLARTLAERYALVTDLKTDVTIIGWAQKGRARGRGVVGFPARPLGTKALRHVARPFISII